MKKHSEKWIRTDGQNSPVLKFREMDVGQFSVPASSFSSSSFFHIREPFLSTVTVGFYLAPEALAVPLL